MLRESPLSHISGLSFFIVQICGLRFDVGRLLQQPFEFACLAWQLSGHDWCGLVRRVISTSDVPAVIESELFFKASAHFRGNGWLARCCAI